MLDQRGGPIGGPPNWGNGFMPADLPGDAVPRQRRPDPEPVAAGRRSRAAQQRDQLDLLGQAQRTARRGRRPRTPSWRPASPATSWPSACRRTPRRRSIWRSETAETQRLYGLDDPRTERFGRRCLLARRLVERGVRFVQVYSGGGHSDENWDAHGDVNKNHELHCGETDRPIAALLDRPEAARPARLRRWWSGPASSAGRRPARTARAATTARAASPPGWPAAASRAGRSIGATDEFGFAAVENKVHVHDLHATILHLMGLDHTLLTYFHGGRDMRLDRRVGAGGRGGGGMKEALAVREG